MAEYTEKDRKSNKLVVVKSNELIEAGYKLSVVENRLLLICISKINSMGVLSVNDIFTVTAHEVMELTGVDRHAAYEALKEGATRLFNRGINIHDGSELLKIHWVSSIRYKPDAVEVELQFSQKITPYISELSRNFTKYGLANVMMFKSNYSIRFYEMFKKWAGNKQVVEVEWIKEKFELQGKYKNIGDLKKWVIDIAMREINDFSDITASYTQIKRGRTVTGFKFEWHPKKTTKAKTHQPKKTMTPVQYERLHQQRCIGKSTEEVKAMIREDESNAERATKKHGVKSATHTQGMKDINSVLAGVIPHKKG